MWCNSRFVELPCPTLENQSYYFKAETLFEIENIQGAIPVLFLSCCFGVVRAWDWRESLEPVLGSQGGIKSKEGRGEVPSQPGAPVWARLGWVWSGKAAVSGQPGRSAYSTTTLEGTKAGVSFCFFSVKLRHMATPSLLAVNFQLAKEIAKMSPVQEFSDTWVLGKNTCIFAFLILPKNSLEF